MVNHPLCMLAKSISLNYYGFMGTVVFSGLEKRAFIGASTMLIGVWSIYYRDEE